MSSSYFTMFPSTIMKPVAWKGFLYIHFVEKIKRQWVLR